MQNVTIETVRINEIINLPCAGMQPEAAYAATVLKKQKSDHIKYIEYAVHQSLP
jgi:hypothetical protein